MSEKSFWNDPNTYSQLVSAVCAVISIVFAGVSIRSSKKSETFSSMSAESEKKSAEASGRIASATENLLQHNLESRKREDLQRICDMGVNIYKQDCKGFDVICKQIGEIYSDLSQAEFEQTILNIARRVGAATNLDDLRKYFPERYSL